MIGERQPTAREISLWRKFERYATENILRAQLNDALAEMTTIAVQFGLSEGLSVPLIAVDLEKKRAEINKLSSHWSKLMSGVTDEKLGIKPVGSDFDIVAPSDMNADELAYFQTLGVHPLIIVAGIVIAVGAIAGVFDIWTQNRAITDEYNKLLEETDKRYCSVPGSDLCKKWLSRKEEVGYSQKEALTEKIKKDIKTIPGVISGGLGAGLSIAIPLGVLLLWASYGRKRS